MTNNPNHNIVPLPDFNEIDEQAASWLARLNGDAVTEEDRSAFEEWVATSPGHAAAFERLSESLTTMQSLSSIWPVGAIKSEPKASIVPLKHVSALVDRLWTFKISRPVAAYGVAVGVVGCVLTLSIGWLNLFPPERYAVYTTGVGERETISLADGSSIVLNTASRLEVRYDETARDITLTYGEGYFDVAPDKARPFSVFAGDGVVQAVGTAFAVRLDDAQVKVIVSEGDVALGTIAFAADQEATSKRDERSVVRKNTVKPLSDLSSGQKAVFSSEIEAVDPISAQETERMLAWRHGMLAYDGETVGDVVRDISRYTNLRIVITDPSVQDIAVTGRFRVDELNAVFNAFEASFGLKVEQTDGGTVYISS